MNQTIKTTLLAISILLISNHDANAQFGKKLKEALTGKSATTETKQDVPVAEKPKEIVNTYVLTDFQKTNAGKVVVFNDYLGNRFDETSADVASFTELANHFIMRAYFDKNVREK